MKLVLASESAWRKEMVGWLGLPFAVVGSGVDEERFWADDPEETVTSLAVVKAEAVLEKVEESRVFGGDDEELVVIGADTVIYADSQLIGKPVDRHHARNIIQKLAGTVHEVWTGVCVLEGVTGEKQVEAMKTTVRLMPMNMQEIEAYLDTHDWVGKAGGYQIQGAIRQYVKEIDGSETNVVGLPMVELVDMLERAGVVVEVDVRRVIEAKLNDFG